MSNNRLKIDILEGGGPVSAKFSHRRGMSPNNYFHTDR